MTDTVTVKSEGHGKTEDEATKMALTNAVRNAFGTKFESNTKIKDHGVVEDSISLGNAEKRAYIKGHETVDSYQLNGEYYKTIKATVSVEKIHDYSKGEETIKDAANDFGESSSKIGKALGITIFLSVLIAMDLLWLNLENIIAIRAKETAGQMAEILTQ